MKKNKSNKGNASIILLNDIWNLKEQLNDPDLTILDVIVEYIERNDLDPDDVGELLAKNKNFVKILENELVQEHIFKTDKKINSFEGWE